MRTTIGMFDSGVGGLSVLRDLRALLPGADIVYFGDTANVPYGGRTDVEVKRLSERAVEVLWARRPDLVVVACNTATSVAINDLRLRYPRLPIVGVVPVLKTAEERSTARRVAVLATIGTFTSQTYDELKRRYTWGVQLLELAQPEWVLLVERGVVDGPEATAAVQSAVAQIMAFGADLVALGCTHFPFLRPVLEAALPGLEILDSGPAVARQVQRVLTANGRLPASGDTGTTRYLCSGDPVRFGAVASQLLHQPVQAVRVR